VNSPKSMLGFVKKFPKGQSKFETFESCIMYLKSMYERDFPLFGASEYEYMARYLFVFEDNVWKHNYDYCKSISEYKIFIHFLIYGLQYRSSYGWDYMKQWNLLDIPVLILHGKNSNVLTDEMLLDLRQHEKTVIGTRRNIQIVSFDNVGHWVPLISELYWRDIKEFLES